MSLITKSLIICDTLLFSFFDFVKRWFFISSLSLTLIDSIFGSVVGLPYFIYALLLYVVHKYYSKGAWGSNPPPNQSPALDPRPRRPGSRCSRPETGLKPCTSETPALPITLRGGPACQNPHDQAASSALNPGKRYRQFAQKPDMSKT